MNLPHSVYAEWMDRPNYETGYPNLDGVGNFSDRHYFAFELNHASREARCVAASNSLSRLTDFIARYHPDTSFVGIRENNSPIFYEWRCVSDRIVLYADETESGEITHFPFVIVEAQPHRHRPELVDHVWYRAEPLTDYDFKVAIVNAVEKYCRDHYSRYAGMVARVEFKQRNKGFEIELKITGLWTAPPEFSVVSPKTAQQFHGVDDEVRNTLTNSHFESTTEFVYRHVADPMRCMVLVRFKGDD